jgi:hypothetical protein
MALAADGFDHAKLQSAVTLLQESFSKTLNDRTELIVDEPLSEEGSKKVGVLYIVNQLFSMYFRLNTLRLCKNLVRYVSIEFGFRYNCVCEAVCTVLQSISSLQTGRESSAAYKKQQHGRDGHVSLLCGKTQHV